jgi:hypothetical protein
MKEDKGGAAEKKLRMMIEDMREKISTLESRGMIEIVLRIKEGNLIGDLDGGAEVDRMGVAAVAPPLEGQVEQKGHILLIRKEGFTKKTA